MPETETILFFSLVLSILSNLNTLGPADDDLSDPWGSEPSRVRSGVRPASGTTLPDAELRRGVFCRCKVFSPAGVASGVTGVSERPMGICVWSDRSSQPACS